MIAEDDGLYEALCAKDGKEPFDFEHGRPERPHSFDCSSNDGYPCNCRSDR